MFASNSVLRSLHWDKDEFVPIEYKKKYKAFIQHQGVHFLPDISQVKSSHKEEIS